jgi:hypothetical protein
MGLRWEDSPLDGNVADPESPFDRWLAEGLDAGWISEGFCGTHDMAPMTETERAEFDDGYDPCLPVLRVWIERT